MRVDDTATLELGGTAPAAATVEGEIVLSMNVDGAIVAYITSSDGAEISDKPAAAPGHPNV